jgi:outer membrane protein TolC
MRSQLITTGAIVALTMIYISGSPAATPDNTGLNAAITMAQQQNPGLVAARARVEATRSAVKQVSALPDPRLSYTQAVEPVETRVGPQWQVLSLSQSFPWFGTLGTRGEAQNAKADAAAAEVIALSWDLRSSVIEAWWELAHLEQSRTTSQDHWVLLSDWEEIARTRYAAGLGAFAEVLKAQIELGILENQLARLESRRAPQLAKLNALLNQPLGQSVTVILPTSVVTLDLDPTTLAAEIDAANPRLKAWVHRAESARAQGRTADKEGWPSLSIGVNWLRHGPARMANVQDDGQDALSATLSVTLPFRRGQRRAAVNQAAHQLEAADASLRSIANTLKAELTRVVFRHDDAQRSHNLHVRTLIPAARQSLAAVQADYQSGNSSMSELIEVEQTLLDLELGLARTDVDLLIARGQIERLIARPLDGGTS